MPPWWLRYLYRLHRMLGVAGAAMLLPVALTGLWLRHRQWIGFGQGWADQLQLWVYRLHSGGMAGLGWLPDLAALCAISLSLSGLGMAWPRRARCPPARHARRGRRGPIWIIRRGA